MTRRHAIITEEGVLALLSKPQNATMTQAEIGAVFGVTKQAAGNVLRALIASGHVTARKDRVLPTLNYALTARLKLQSFRPSHGISGRSRCRVTTPACRLRCG